MKFHHIGIIVKNLNQSVPILERLFNSKKYSKIIIDRKWKVKLIFIQHKKKILFEIIQPLNKKSPISNSLKKNINTINHLAFISKNFNKDKKIIIENGCIPVTQALEAIAFKKKKIQFFLAKENFLIELIESNSK